MLLRVSLVAVSALAVSVAASMSACKPGSLVGQPCAKNGDTVCEGTAQLRCDTGYYVKLAECVSDCLAGLPDVSHDVATIDADETWQCADGPHLVPATILVSAGVTLTIEAGSLLKLQPASRIDTDPAGRVDAIGDGNAPILLTSNNGEGAGFGAGSEGGLNVFAVEDGTPSDIEHVIIERGRHGLGVFGLSATATAPVVKDNTLRDNTNYGILLACSGANPVVPDFKADGNQFFNNGGEISECNVSALP